MHKFEDEIQIVEFSNEALQGVPWKYPIWDILFIS